MEITINTVNPNDELQKLIDNYGSQSAAAIFLNVAESRISQAKTGRINWPDDILDRMGLERVEYVVRKNEGV